MIRYKKTKRSYEVMNGEVMNIVEIFVKSLTFYCKIFIIIHTVVQNINGESGENPEQTFVCCI